MSESERRLLLSGTLDTSGVGGGADEELQNVALAFQDVTLLPGDAVSADEELREFDAAPEEGASEAPLVDRPKIPVKTAKKTAAPKKQASSPDKS